MISTGNYLEGHILILGFKPIPECATHDSRVSDKEEFVILYTEFKW